MQSPVLKANRRPSMEFISDPLSQELSPRSLRIKQLQKELLQAQKELAMKKGEATRETLARVLGPKIQQDTIAVTVNHELLSVARAMDMNYDAKFELVSTNSDLGMNVYRASLAFVLGMAVRELFPSRAMRVEHSFGLESSALSTAYYCELVTLDEKGESYCSVSITPQEIELLQERMRTLVEQNIPIDVVLVNTSHAIAALEASHLYYSKRLLESKNAPAVFLNRCLDYSTLHLRPLAPRTGLLQTFSLQPFQSGLLLCFPLYAGALVAAKENKADNTPAASLSLSSSPPHTHTHTHAHHYTHIHDVWSRDNQLWNNMDVGCVGQLNTAIMQGMAQRLCRLCEASHDLNIVEVAKAIAARRETVRIVLIAGPSSSGKTTFANKLSVHLEILGMRPVALSVDDYYKGHSDPTYPRDESGVLDFEDVRAIRTDLLHEHLVKLFAGEEVEVPRYDFKTGHPKAKGVPTRLGKGGVIIAEGIFCLNEQLTSRIPSEQKFKIYISPMSQLNVDEQSFFSNQMIRVIRRISRDYMSRGRNAEQTIQKWNSVRAGEEKNIFPFLGQADVVFNSSLEYELPVLSVFVSPLLRTVSPTSSAYLTARQLLAFLEQFQPIPTQLVPSTSLLQEFIGGEE